MSKADFRVASVAPEVSVPVKFENLSFNAAIYAWDFGDGNKDSLTVAPEHTYTAPGNYLVKLKAYTEDRQVSEAVKEVKVGERFLTGMFLVSISMTDAQGNPWDNDGSGPDVLFQLGPTDAITLNDLVFVFFDSLNVGKANNTPVGITVGGGIPNNYKLSNKDYFILLEEIDEDGEELVFTSMAEVVFNPVIPEDEFITITKRADNTGDIVIPFIVLDQFQFFLTFVIR